MRMHIQEVSESASSIAEHDLSDLVPSYSYSPGNAHPVLHHPSTSTAAGYFRPLHVASHDHQAPTRHPPRAIVYAASTAGHSSSSSNTSQHPVALIPTVSPPRYQLSLSHPGSPPSRAGTHASSSPAIYPPEARRAPPSPPLSHGSAPAVLYGTNHTDAGYNVTYQTDPSRAVSNPEHIQPRRNITGLASLPEYEDVESGNEPIEPLTDEQHARITAEQYRLGVGYDEASTGTLGKRISDQRRLERLRALEKEFGRVKNENRLTSSGTSPGTPEDKLKKSGNKPARYEEEKREGENDDASSENMSFKQLRAKQKAEKARLDEELGVTKDGNLLTKGRRTRLALRWTQGLLGLVAVVTGLGGAFFTHPAKDEDPPPSGVVSTWFLYIVSLASFICTMYLFTIQPCIRRRKAKTAQSVHQQMPNGIVLPIFSSSHAYNAIGVGKMKKGAFGGVGGRKGKKGYKMNSQPPMMVNLVVDPSMLGGGLSPSLGNGYKPPSRYDDSGFDDDEDHHETSSKTRKNETAEILYDASRGEAGVEENEEDDHDFDIPDAKAKAERARKARRNNQPLVRMMDTMSVMKLQDRWREARRRMRKMALIDAIWAVTWCAQSLFAIGYGGSCKPGSAAGWCDTYNMALASGVLLCVAFSTSFVFDILDLRRSRNTPRISRML